MSTTTIPLLDDDTVGFGEEEKTGSRQFRHPYVAFFHVAFRAAALLVYLFCGWFIDGFVASFVSVVILLSFDFWTVKNISGRLMVGLRWWSYVDEEGKSHWVYESKKDSDVNKALPADARLFWTGLLAFPILWALLLLIALFKFSFRWLVLVVVALTLQGANVHGYLRCRLGQGQSITSSVSGVVTNFFQKQLFQNMMTNVLSRGAQPTTASGSSVI